jgi:hypothetical protein
MKQLLISNYGSTLLYLKRFVDLIVSEKSLILIY